MLNNRYSLFVIRCSLFAALAFAMPAMAEMEVDIVAEETRPVFMQIADLEQEKVLLQLEKEKAQIMLELDRMAIEQQRIRADSVENKSAAEIERLETLNTRLEREKETLQEQIDKLKAEARAAPREAATATAAAAQAEEEAAPTLHISQRYRLIDIVGAGRQLQATVEDLKTGQRKRVVVGRQIDGYDVKSISLDDGIVFMRDGVAESLNVGNIDTR
ncbi:MAG: type IV pilus biogenesis protein PilP [Alphaproteobacteria bacterium]|nr:type IV pilus biogenesis protein PilP [Alphaproteobacteria bacterium]